MLRLVRHEVSTRMPLDEATSSLAQTLPGCLADMYKRSLAEHT